MKSKKIIRIIIAVLLAVALIVPTIATIFSVSAATLEQQLKDAQKQREAAQAELNAVAGKRKDAQESKNKIDAEISSLNSFSKRSL